jgi:SAM-dependent methyltransferase
MSGTIGESRFWRALWKRYYMAPSIALCRVPELEYASRLESAGGVLDHGCGDGHFAALAWPGKTVTAGCDIDEAAVARARKLGIHQCLDVCDVTQRLPYEAESFDLIFNNSAIEHVKDLDAALAEVGRVLSPGGTFVFNVLNHRYFEWWPLASAEAEAYRQWQPFYHALSLSEWEQRLSAAGLTVVAVDGYFDQQAARELAYLDHAFSGMYIAQRRHPLVWWYRYLPPLWMYWRRRLSRLNWRTGPDAGAGYSIQAVHAHG